MLENILCNIMASMIWDLFFKHRILDKILNKPLKNDSKIKERIFEFREKYNILKKTLKEIEGMLDNKDDKKLFYRLLLNGKIVVSSDKNKKLHILQEYSSKNPMNSINGKIDFINFELNPYKKKVEVTYSLNSNYKKEIKKYIKEFNIRKLI